MRNFRFAGHSPGTADSKQLYLELRIEMKRKLFVSLLFVVALAFVAFVIESGIEKRAEQKRQAAYESTLREYSMTLNPGLQRSAVENVLVSQGRTFRQMCCLLNENRHALEDIVKIGSEPKPWYCSENDTYLVFEFDSSADPNSPGARADDRLRRIALASWLGGCL